MGLILTQGSFFHQGVSKPETSGLTLPLTVPSRRTARPLTTLKGVFTIELSLGSKLRSPKGKSHKSFNFARTTATELPGTTTHPVTEGPTVCWCGFDPPTWRLPFQHTLTARSWKTCPVLQLKLHDDRGQWPLGNSCLILMRNVPSVSSAHLFGAEIQTLPVSVRTLKSKIKQIIGI